jgi:hypothetical protein
MNTQQEQRREKRDADAAPVLARVDAFLTEIGFKKDARGWGLATWYDGQGARVDYHFIGGSWHYVPTDPRLKFSLGFGHTVNLGVKNLDKTLARIKADTLNHRQVQAAKRVAAEARGNAQAEADLKIKAALEARYPAPLIVEQDYQERGLTNWEVREGTVVRIRYAFNAGTTKVARVMTFPNQDLAEVLKNEKEVQ